MWTSKRAALCFGKTSKFLATICLGNWFTGLFRGFWLQNFYCSPTGG